MPWVKGQSGNPLGRRSRVSEDEYAAALRRALPPERLVRIVTAVARRAEDGDPQAFKVLAPFILRELPKQVDVNANLVSFVLQWADGEPTPGALVDGVAGLLEGGDGDDGDG